MLFDRIKGIIFDLDNTLVETNTDYIHRTVDMALKYIGYEKGATMKKACRFWYGFYGNEDIKEMWSVNPDSFWKSFRFYDELEERIKNTGVYDDVIKSCDVLNSKKIGIITSAPTKIALAEKKLVDSYIDIDSFIVAHEDNKKGIKSKPDPDGVYRCLEELGLEAVDVFMVGDSPSDGLAAQAAGVFDVFLERHKVDMGKYKPSIITPDIYGLFWL